MVGLQFAAGSAEIIKEFLSDVNTDKTWHETIEDITFNHQNIVFPVIN